MFRYNCPACKGNQYSSSSEKSDEPCVYCGHEGTELMGAAEDEQPLTERQKEFEETYSRDEFRQLIGKSYL